MLESSPGFARIMFWKNGNIRRYPKITTSSTAVIINSNPNSFSFENSIKIKIKASYPAIMNIPKIKVANIFNIGNSRTERTPSVSLSSFPAKLKAAMKINNEITKIKINITCVVKKKSWNLERPMTYNNATKIDMNEAIRGEVISMCA